MLGLSPDGSQVDLGLFNPQLPRNPYSFPVHGVGNRDLKEQLLNAYEAGYTATVAKGRVSPGLAFYVNRRQVHTHGEDF